MVNDLAIVTHNLDGNGFSFLVYYTHFMNKLEDTKAMCATMVNSVSTMSVGGETTARCQFQE